MSTITRDATVTTGELLTDDMLRRFDERAPVYDRENRFFTEDFDELRAPGYLLAAVPTELGGSGLALNEVMRLQQRLAYHASATAVAVNMHLYWTGLAANLALFGDHRCDFILREAADGHVFAAATARPATTWGCSPRPPRRPRSTAAGRDRPKGVRQPVARVDLPGPPRHGHVRRGRPEGHPRVPAPDVQLPHREDLGRHGHAGHLQRGHRLRRRLRARRAGPGRLPGRRGRCRPVPPQPAGVGPARLRQRLRRAPPAGPTTWWSRRRRPGARSASPAARRTTPRCSGARRDAHGPRGHRRLSRPQRRLVGRRGPRGRLAAQDRRQALRRRRRSRWSTPRST